MRKLVSLAALLALALGGCIVHAHPHHSAVIVHETGCSHHAGCGHYRHNGSWYYAKGHHHARGCGHAFVGGFWIVE
jgi:hypothetical protein